MSWKTCLRIAKHTGGTTYHVHVSPGVDIMIIKILWHTHTPELKWSAKRINSFNNLYPPSFLTHFPNSSYLFFVSEVHCIKHIFFQMKIQATFLRKAIQNRQPCPVMSLFLCKILLGHFSVNVLQLVLSGSTQLQLSISSKLTTLKLQRWRLADSWYSHGPIMSNFWLSVETTKTSPKPLGLESTVLTIQPHQCP